MRPRRRNHLLAIWRRVRCGWRRYQWPLVAALWLAALSLGCFGFARHFAARGEARSPWDLLYLSLQLIALESGAVSPIGWELGVARLLAPAMAGYTAVQALAAVFSEQLQSLRLRRFTGHVVICGLGRKGSLLARCFLERGQPVVVVEHDENDGWLEACREQGAIVLTGDATNPELLRRARVQRASLLMAVAGDDGANAEVAVRACRMVAGRKGATLTCFVHIVDPRLCSLLRERELAMEKAGAFRLEFFNVFESGARALLDEFPPFAPAEWAPTRVPHLLVIGVGRMGESVVVNAARAWRAKSAANGQRLRVTIIDWQAEPKLDLLRLRYPLLDRACQLSALPIDVRGPEFERAAFLFGPRGDCDVSAVYVCLDNDSLGLSTGLALLQRLREEKVPIVVRMADEAGLATLLRGVEGIGGFDSLRAFPLLDRTCRPEALLDGHRAPVGEQPCPSGGGET